MGSPEKGVALARSHTHSGILADRTVSQIIGVLLTVSLCQAGRRKHRSIYRVDLEKVLMNEREGKRERCSPSAEIPQKFGDNMIMPNDIKRFGFIKSNTFLYN